MLLGVVCVAMWRPPALRQQPGPIAAAAPLPRADICYLLIRCPQMSPKYRPLERFWPYADLPEQPTDEELAALDPDLQEALFGARPRSVFDHAGVSRISTCPISSRRSTLARAAAEFRETGSGAARRYRARFWSTDALALARRCFRSSVCADATEVLIDDRPVPYARELWLPLVWLVLAR